MDNLLYILLAAALTDNIITNRMYGISLLHGIHNAWPMATLISCATAVLLLLAITFGYVLRQLSLAGDDGLIVPVLLPLLSVAVVAALTWHKLDHRWQAIVPLATANPALLAIPLAQASEETPLITSIVVALGSALGFYLVLLVICEIRERLWLADIPETLRGLPILMLMLGSISIGMYGLRT